MFIIFEKKAKSFSSLLEIICINFPFYNPKIISIFVGVLAQLKKLISGKSIEILFDLKAWPIPSVSRSSNYLVAVEVLRFAWLLEMFD